MEPLSRLDSLVPEIPTGQPGHVTPFRIALPPPHPPPLFTLVLSTCFNMGSVTCNHTFQPRHMHPLPYQRTSSIRTHIGRSLSCTCTQTPRPDSLSFVRCSGRGHTHFQISVRSVIDPNTGSPPYGHRWNRRVDAQSALAHSLTHFQTRVKSASANCGCSLWYL